MDLGAVFEGQSGGSSRTSGAMTFKSLVKGVHAHFLRDPSHLGGMHMLPTAEVPDTRCVQSLYLAIHSMSLPSEYAGQGFEEPCSDSDKEDVEKIKAELEEVIKKEDSTREDLDNKTKDLQDRLMKIGEKIY
jgi:hypothetical protein